MPYFHINGIGFNCGYNKLNCPKILNSCYECIEKRLSTMGFEINQEFRIFEIESDEKRLKIEREQIWQKFLDVLNIKHIIIMDKESGLPILNYAVSGVEIDPGLLSGFIQANITFSESEQVSPNRTSSVVEQPFYEFQYKSFNILLRNGECIRLCLILDHKASDSMRYQMLQFLGEFEDTFKEDLLKFQDTGAIDFDEMIEYIVKSFNVNLVFPMTLAHSIPPHEIKKITKISIQKAIYNLAKELLISKPFFFINKLLNRVKNIVNIDAEIVLFEINKLLERKIIVPTKLEAVINKIETTQEANHKKINAIKPISSIIITDSDLEQLKADIETIDELTAKKLIKEFMKKGKTAEKDRAFQVASKEYNKALFIAKELKLKGQIYKISNTIFELDNTTKKVELHFALEKAENYEKNKDYINSIHFYQKAVKLLEKFLIYNLADADSQLKKLKKKIIKLREEI